MTVDISTPDSGSAPPPDSGSAPPLDLNSGSHAGHNPASGSHAGSDFSCDSCPVPVFLFEDHCQSYLYWKSRGLKGLTVVHVDAHLDVRDDGLTPKTLEKIRQTDTWDELSQFRKNKDVLWDGFHPGNYLYPALMDGTVKELIWVVPPHLQGGNSLLEWLKQEIQEWVDITLNEFSILKEEERRITGKLFNMDFCVCLIEDLKPISEKAVWDLDTDYLINEKDIPWTSPADIVDKLKQKCPHPEMITIAYSVNGGYTHPRQKYLGNIWKEIIEWEFANRIEGKEEKIERWNKAFSLIRQSHEEILLGEWDKGLAILNENEFLINGLNLLIPYIDLSKSYIYSLKGDGEKEKIYKEKAFQLNPSLDIPIYDQAMIYFRKKEYPQALSLLRESATLDPLHFMMSHFISAVIYIKMNKFEESCRHWQEIIIHQDFNQWSDGVKAHIFYLFASTLYEAQDYPRALKYINDSLSLEENQPRGYYRRGQIYMALEDYDKASRDLRKYLWERPDRMESLSCGMMLAECYQKLNKPGMARAEYAKIQKKDVIGFYSAKAGLKKLKLPLL